MPHEVEEMFSVRKTPWHGLGSVVQRAPTTADAIRLAGLDWRVGLKPLQLREQNGQADPVSVPAQAVVRESDNSILGVVGPKWHPLQNADAFRWFDPFVETGLCRFETAGSLQQGRRVWILAEITGGAAEIGPGDAVRRFLLLSNSHDGSLAVRIGFTPIRVVCANTLAAAHAGRDSQLVRFRHTSGLVRLLDDFRDVVRLANRTFEATVEQYQHLARSRTVSRNDLREYVKRVLDLSKAMPKTTSQEIAARGRGGLTVQSAEALAAVLENFDSGKGAHLATATGTWWGAYNAVTEYLSYTRGKTQEARLDSLWFGDSARLSREALTVALQLSA